MWFKFVIAVCADTFSIELIAQYTSAGGVSWVSSGDGIFFPDNFQDTTNYVPQHC